MSNDTRRLHDLAANLLTSESSAVSKLATAITEDFTLATAIVTEYLSRIAAMQERPVQELLSHRWKHRTRNDAEAMGGIPEMARAMSTTIDDVARLTDLFKQAPCRRRLPHRLQRLQHQSRLRSGDRGGAAAVRRGRDRRPRRSSDETRHQRNRGGLRAKGMQGTAPPGVDTVEARKLIKEGDYT